MSAPLIPAALAFDAGGTPWSPAYGDVYHSSEGGLAQARHVFLGGNRLPARWAGRERFVLLETGFGAGLNFLATWQAWREDTRRPARLHYVTVEKHPFAAHDLATLHARVVEHAEHRELSALAAQLRAAWPMAVPGMHRLEFEGGRVVLTLAYADIAAALPQLRLVADAIYLDGFSPARNPDMWAAPVLKALGRLAAPDATLASYTAATAVRDTLTHSGWRVEKRPGFARKRDMLSATRESTGATRESTESMRVPPRAMRADAPLGVHAAGAPQRRAIVIGAGLAGAAVCERLGTRGWDLLLLERHSAPAMEASGNHAGAFHPVVTRDDSILARLTRAAFLDALQRWPRIEGANWAACGALQMGRDAEEEAAQQEAMQRLGYPREYARWVSREDAEFVVGRPVAAGGLWFERGGWMQPAGLAAALVARSGAHVAYGTEVAALAPCPGGWAALDAGGRELGRAPQVVLANAADAQRLAVLPAVQLRQVRGQLSYLPAGRFAAPACVLLRGGSLLPAVHGLAVAGASYDIDDADLNTRVDSHAGNLERLARILPGAEAGFDPHTLAGRAALRCVAGDRLPLVGPIPGAPGLLGALGYASRGILWCMLMAELLACTLEGEPLPIEGQLADAVAAGRFQRRALRKKG